MPTPSTRTTCRASLSELPVGEAHALQSGWNFQGAGGAVSRDRACQGFSGVREADLHSEQSCVAGGV